MNTNEPSTLSDDAALDPAAMLALAQSQQKLIAGQMGSFVPLILLAWGIAWLLGFGALWLVDGLGDAFSLPIAVAAPIFGGLLLAAGALSTVLGIRSGRGLRGGKEGAFAGIVYGQSWWVGSVAVWLIGQALVVNGMSTELLGIFYPSAFIFFAGIMYISAGVIWKAIPMVALGLWSVVLSAVAPFFGNPTHYLIFAIAGGGSFLVASFASIVWLRRARHRIAGERS